MTRVSHIDKFFAKLTDAQKRYLFEKLKKVVLAPLSNVVKECPCCNTTNFMKYGSYKGVVRYMCRNTNKTFSSKTKTVVAGISDTDKLLEMLNLMSSSGKLPTLDELCRKLKIYRQTAFDWRTKIIDALYKELKFDNEVIEFDETYFMISRKGRQGMEFGRKKGLKKTGDNDYNVKVLMAYSRTSKNIEMTVSHMGRSTEQHIANYLNLKQNVVVYSDSHPSYKSYYNKKGVLHGMFKSKDHVSLTDRNIHNQTINYYSGALSKFLDQDLRGVSTKYLQGYLNWFMFVENVIKKSEEEVSLIDTVMENKVAMDVFKQKEKAFQYFLRNNGRTNYGTCREKYVLERVA